MEKMVAGFAFNKDMDRVILIKKTRPEWQKGQLNGVGGRIGVEEGKYTAMKREFEEETGVLSSEACWNLFFRLTGTDWDVFFFYSIMDISKCKSVTDEMVLAIDPLNMPDNMISNLKWLIPMAMYKNRFPEELMRTW